MRAPHVLLLASVFLLAVVVGSFLLPAGSRPAAETHGEYPSVDTTIRGSRGTLVPGYLMALGILATTGASVVLGVRRRGRSGRLGRWLAVGFAGLAVIYTVLVLSYARYAEGAGEELFLSLPPPTAWMLYGAWVFPLLMIIAGMVHFDAYLSEDDEKRFDELVRSRRQGADRDAG